MLVEKTVIKSLKDDDGNVDIDVTSEIATEDELLVILLLVVEKMTGVSTSTYVDEVDAKRGV